MSEVRRSRIDFQDLGEGTVHHYINLARYDSTADNWFTLSELLEKEVDFLDLIFIKLAGKTPLPRERRLFLRSLLVLSMGTGAHPPSVSVPKLIASTTKSPDFAIINGLIGGLASVGTHHLGSICEAMRELQQVYSLACSSSQADVSSLVSRYVEKKLSKGETIHGFGHPVYAKDPRPDLILKEVKLYGDHPLIEVYSSLASHMHLRRNVSPNVDCALGLSYLILGFDPQQGTYLSFLSRSLSMVCHILEEIPQKPFSFLHEMGSYSEREKKKSPKRKPLHAPEPLLPEDAS